jgi:hypothetical protein
VKCQTAYFSSFGLCQANNPRCLSTEYRGGRCLSCYTGYVLFNGDCYDISQQPACLTYDFRSVCVQCRNRFFLTAGTCRPVDPLCLDYRNDTGTCTSCLQGYGLSSLTLQCVLV